MSPHLAKYYDGKIDISTLLELLQDDYLKAAMNYHIAFPIAKDDVEDVIPLLTERYCSKILSDFREARSDIYQAQLDYYLKFPDELKDVLEKVYGKADLSGVRTIKDHYDDCMEDAEDRRYDYQIDEYIDYVNDCITDA